MVVPVPPLNTAYWVDITPKETVVAVSTPVGYPLNGIPEDILPSKVAVSPVNILACLARSNNVVNLFIAITLFKNKYLELRYIYIKKLYYV